MNVRLSTQAPINDPSSIFRPGAKIIHRGDPDIVLGDGTHTLLGRTLVSLESWYPIELLHFPFRTRAQTERKFVNAWHAWTRNPNRPPPHYYAKAHSAIREGRLDDFLDSLTVGDDSLARGLAEGSLVIDNRLRNALRGLKSAGGSSAIAFRMPSEERELAIARPDFLEETRYAVDAAVLNEADVVRLQRRIDQLEPRLAALDRLRRPWLRS